VDSTKRPHGKSHGTPNGRDMTRIPQSLPRRSSIVAILSFTAIWLWVALCRPLRPPSQSSGSVSNNIYQDPEIRDVFDFPPIESEAIKNVCANTVWNSTIVFTCDNSVGDVADIRNSILSCVRYAISAGCGLVMPRIVLRAPSNAAEIQADGLVEFDYMFDSHHFKESLRLSCPELEIIDSVDELLNYKATHEPLSLHAESFEKEVPKTGLSHPEQWRSQFQNWLANPPEAIYDGVIIIALQRSYMQFPIYSDGEEFAASFGNILKFQTAVRIIATTTLHRLSENYYLNMNLSESIVPHAFLGVHLDIEKNAGQGYLTYAAQSKLYLEQAAKNNISLIYVASSNAIEVSKLAADGTGLSISVATKFDLLQGTDKKMLDGLAWNQQAIVDFLVMLKASSFGGIAHSSFSWNIALKRHIYAKVEVDLKGPQMLSDDLSQVYETPFLYPQYPSCLWP
jgi:hypothetical protein